MTVSKSFYVYEFSYPEGMPAPAGTIFYVGKGTYTMRMDAHFKEAENGCQCKKCESIKSIWNANQTVIRRIVFESTSEVEALNEEKRRIHQHQSPFLTNIQGTAKDQTKKPVLTRVKEAVKETPPHPFQSNGLPIRTCTGYENDLVNLILPPNDTLLPPLVETTHTDDGKLTSIQARRFRPDEKLVFTYTMTPEQFRNRGF